ncbi:hypothetical protein [Megalodesulfovibrio gigas]|uniref:Uncharacterized protein n=1 Tax=Megalodesulfovibrio gigas (strain ATCC 19364 / DSM 1382 / NCIMB 9332 / VKM B-1759) TaxID=1121448 RepID=T2GEC2_MEGG1|nr:hypothetical protein [Megalodesulfovibrio gigas]AGW14476.1 hypothetical protein DGI_2745 [Megalodesulfovibrio gigas DSM 1382 = ATCC 19364]
MISVFDVYFAYTACVGCLDFLARLYLYQRAGLSFRLLPSVRVSYWRDVPVRVTALPCDRPADVVAAHQLCLFLETLLAPLFVMALIAANM